MSNEVLIKNGNKANWGMDNAPIDPERLPEGYPYKAIEKVALVENMSVEPGYHTPSTYEVDFEFTVGETYTVEWNGKTYECTAALMEGTGVIGNLIIMGIGDDTGEPFVMYTYGGNLYIKGEGDTAILSIYGVAEIIHPISSDFLPPATPTAAGAMRQAAAVANVTAAPTAEEFNALLKSLRDAGILATS